MLGDIADDDFDVVWQDVRQRLTKQTAPERAAFERTVADIHPLAPRVIAGIEHAAIRARDAGELADRGVFLVQRRAIADLLADSQPAGGSPPLTEDFFRAVARSLERRYVPGVHFTVEGVRPDGQFAGPGSAEFILTALASGVIGNAGYELLRAGWRSARERRTGRLWRRVGSRRNLETVLVEMAKQATRIQYEKHELPDAPALAELEVRSVSLSFDRAVVELTAGHELKATIKIPYENLPATGPEVTIWQRRPSSGRSAASRL